ncbi:MAG: hypothetical protein R2941_18605 [Desulfobacterales bacterium]
MKDSPLFKNWGLFKKGMRSKDIQLSFANHLEYSLSKDKFTATPRDLYLSLALTARDRMIERWIKTQQMYHDHDVKRVYYLSAEYLMGRVLINNLINLGIYEETRQAMKEIHMDLEEIAEMEPDMGLGNGGLEPAGRVFSGFSGHTNCFPRLASAMNLASLNRRIRNLARDGMAGGAANTAIHGKIAHGRNTVTLSVFADGWSSSICRTGVFSQNGKTPVM